MHVDGVHLRRRMRSLDAGDLLKIVDNARGDYAPAAVEAARQELASRPQTPPDSDDGSTSDSSRDDFRSRLPPGLRFTFWLSTAAFCASSALTVVVVGFFVADVLTLRELVSALSQLVVGAASALWIAVAIRAEHVYVRTLLLALISAAAVYQIMLMVAARQVTPEAINGLALLAVALWYFGFSGDVIHYYRTRRMVRHSTSD